MVGCVFMHTTRKRKPTLRQVRVGDVMHEALIGVPAGTPVSMVAELMATQRVHAVAIVMPGQSEEWKIVSALDVVAAATVRLDPAIEDIPTKGALTVSGAESVQAAARLMAEQGHVHLIIVDPATGHPNGVLSALDVLTALTT